MPKTFRYTNTEVVQLLKEAVAAMEVKGYNVFRIRAYQNAIGAIQTLTSNIYDLWQNKRLDEIPGVGAGLSDHLNELFTSGEVREFKQIKQGLPEGMFVLIGVRGIGAKRAFKLAKEFRLEIRDEAVERLKAAAEQRKIREMEGFGEKSESDILNAISEMKMTKNEKPRLLLINAEEISGRVCSYIKKLAGVEEAIPLGSMRRRNPTVGDLDIAVVCDNSDEALKHFLKFPEIHEVLAEGDKKVSVNLTNDTQVDIRVTPKDSFGSMVQYSTGNKLHNIALRTYGLGQGKSLSEYGIKYQDKLHKFATEEEFYKFLGLPYIEPELRQGNDEIEKALSGKLPNLVQLKDIKGDIHTHTIASDGLNTLAEMVNAAKERGYLYIGIADHAPSVVSRGYDEVVAIVDKQRKSIDAINQAQDDIKVLFGYEVNILADATLGLPDEILDKLDYVIASVHTAFNQDRKSITDRIVKALENPYVSILGHPSGRLINERGPVDADWEKVFKVAEENDKILEINGQPNRLDLEDDLVKDAVRRGVKFIINTDAHDIGSLDYMKYGIDVARRGWCEKKDIINTLNFKEFVSHL